MTRTEKEAKEIKELRNGLKRQVSELARLVFEDSLEDFNRKFCMTLEVCHTHVGLRIHDTNTCDGIENVEMYGLDDIFEPVNFIHPLEGIRRNVKKADIKLKDMKALFLKYKKLNNK
ncbi:hypothetical protein [Marinifilum flexuosum]|uniref:Uncharacterized protein n=1 Tax=Marinifilum flexuosum TaxID=1117708 RepID=A0A419X3N6_9BACT|nr:hypothetical protein [Marinifilum flexuosum]RKE02328.1 hypothetical protein BXY64_2416 [Marinifilum flexuosum]